MAFMNEIYNFKNIFRDVEKATKKCVHLNSAIEINLYVICVKLKTHNENKHYFIINNFSDLVISNNTSHSNNITCLEHSNITSDHKIIYSDHHNRSSNNGDYHIR